MTKLWLNRVMWGLGLATAVVGTIIAYVSQTPIPADPNAIPEGVEVHFGWGGEEGAEAAYQAVEAELPVYEIAEGEADDPTKTVVLWERAKENNGGKHLPTFRQLIGDCVGASSLQATQYLITTADEGQFVPLWIGYTYACGRMAPELGAGRLRGPDGSFGSYQALAARDYGWLLASEGPEYTTASIRQWAVRMPPRDAIEKGKRQRVGSVVRVRTADEIRKAIQSGYPVTIASNWGGLMTPPVVDVGDGRKLRLNRRSGQWAHQMCVIGYCYVNDKGYWYVLNSWGENAHGAPVNDEPPGGFWIARVDMDWIARSDCWAYSDTVGFPHREFDFQIFDENGFESVKGVDARKPDKRRSFAVAM